MPARSPSRGRQNDGMADAEDRVVLEFDLPITGAPDAFGESFAAAPVSEGLELGEGLEGDPAVAFRRTLGMFATGVTIITTRSADDQVHGMTANAFMSVSLDPPLVLISIDRRAKMLALLHEGSSFGVNVLEGGQAGLSDRFAGRAGDDLPEPSFTIVHGTPLVDGALAHLVARVVRSYWGGDHSLFLGRVEYAHYGEGTPLLFHGGRYERLEASAELFSSLPPELLEPLLANGVERTYAAGETLMERGTSDDELMLVSSGDVRVERPGRTITLGAGAIVGEIEVLDPGHGRTASVTAVTDTTCIVVSGQALRSSLGRDPQAALALLRILAARLRH